MHNGVIHNLFLTLNLQLEVMPFQNQLPKNFFEQILAIKFILENI